MGEVIWVEVLSRHREVTARHRCTGPEIRIGRGYANDVILDDPYVAPEHLLVRRDEAGALVAENVGGANGLFVGKSREAVERAVLDGDRPIRIGHTELRIREASHVVPRARAYTPPRRRWPVLLALAAAILGIELASLWLNETTEPKLSRYLMPPLGLTLFALGWAAVWSVLGRIFSGQARYERQLLITLSGMFAYSLYNEVDGIAAFSLGWPELPSYEYIGMWCILAAMGFCHLQAIFPARPRVKGAVIAGLAGLVIALQTLTQSELRGGLDQRVHAHRLLPPALRLAPLRSEDAFLADVERLKGKLDRDRATPGPLDE
jgi:pSer/pThr/pTyr-binding forkhead associated (FHA) protein